jgi:hypothetical protein
MHVWDEEGGVRQGWAPSYRNVVSRGSWRHLAAEDGEAVALALHRGEVVRQLRQPVLERRPLLPQLQDLRLEQLLLQIRDDI